MANHQGSASDPTAKAIKDFLNEPFEEQAAPRLFVHNEADFRNKMESYLSLTNDAPTSKGVDDYPEDAEAQQDLAQKLVDAMTNIANAEDKDSKIPVARVQKLSPIEFHLMAWNVLLEIRDVHRGNIRLPRWGRDWERQECETFAERFEAVRQVLYSHKAAVSSLFSYCFAKRLALDPRAESSRKTTNKKGNEKRQKDNTTAKRLREEAKASQAEQSSSAGASATQVSNPAHLPDQSLLQLANAQQTSQANKRRKIAQPPSAVDSTLLRPAESDNLAISHNAPNNMAGPSQPLAAGHRSAGQATQAQALGASPTPTSSLAARWAPQAQATDGHNMQRFSPLSLPTYRGPSYGEQRYPTLAGSATPAQFAFGLDPIPHQFVPLPPNTASGARTQAQAIDWPSAPRAIDAGSRQAMATRQAPALQPNVPDQQQAQPTMTADEPGQPEQWMDETAWANELIDNAMEPRNMAQGTAEVNFDDLELNLDPQLGMGDQSWWEDPENLFGPGGI